jgi:hypothetical protein
MTTREINQRIDEIVYAINSITIHTDFSIVAKLETELHLLLNLARQNEEKKNVVIADFKARTWEKLH